MEILPGADGQIFSLTAAALENGESGYSCAEAVLVAFGGRFGIDEKTAMKIAGGFGGGMGRMGETCGAVAAAIMVLGLEFGAETVADAFARENTYLKAAEFIERFVKKRGSLLCRELCAGHGMATAAQVRTLRESGLPAKMVQTAAEILSEMLFE